MLKKIFVSLILFIFFVVCGFADDKGGMLLSFDEASRLALLNNFDIQLTKYDIQIAREEQGIAKSIFDTILQAQIELDKDKSRKNSLLLDDDVRETDYSFGLSKKMPTGTTVSVEQESLRTNNSVDTSLQYNPVYDSSLTVKIKQELGRNFFGLIDRGDIKVTESDIRISEYTSLDKIEQYLADVQKAYWEFVCAGDIYAIEQNILEQAEKFQELNERLLDHGVVEVPDLFGAQADYNVKKSMVLAAEDNLEKQLNVLKLMLNLGDIDVDIMPSDQLAGVGKPYRLDDAMINSMLNRRDYMVAKEDVIKQGIILSMKKNSLWPEINLEASFSKNGLDEHFNDSYKDITSDDRYSYYAGVTVKVPLFDRKARAEKKQAQYSKAKALVNLKYVERSIYVEINDQVRKCNVLAQQIGCLENAVKLQEKKVNEQMRIFKRGRSDSDTVIRFQNEFLDAELELTNMKKEYCFAVIELKRLEGILLKEYWDYSFDKI
ncbi:MAG: TolC family protein [Candidatus Omnitrophica bacterium]|nr:TolC family protein [Candidatus Omnitrophota bacterium]MDD5440663.1 TolC family protein [Candidatus Omnitrophota bacterium]